MKNFLSIFFQKARSRKIKKNNGGMIIADFLFSFVLVLAVGIFIFGLTFSLATIEVAQYVVWSTARNYAAGNENEAVANAQARDKFESLANRFPFLTSPAWFELSFDDLQIGNLDPVGISSADKVNDNRQPWTGATTTINLTLFSGLKIPFLGPVATSRDAFKFPIYAFLIRNVSKTECRTFFYGPNHRYIEGISKLEGGTLAPAAFGLVGVTNITNGYGEDNGC